MGVRAERSAETPVVAYPIRLANGGFEVLGSIRLPRRGRELPAMTVHGGILYEAVGRVVEKREPFADHGLVFSAELDEEPGALIGAGRGCIAGLVGRLDYVDFSTAEPEARTLYMDEKVHKPVDFLVRLGKDRLVAVDDEVFPRYGMFFDLVPGDVLAHVATVDLPSHPNDRYMDVVEAGGLLVMTSSYAVMEGSGNILYRWDPAKMSLAGLPRVEHLPRMGSPDSGDLDLLAGKTMTYWHGMAAIGDRVFICAQQRGLIHLDAGGGGAGLQNVGGSCMDVLAQAGRLVVLVDEEGLDQSVLLELEWREDEGRLVELARHKIGVAVDEILQ
jgi:hypothetical protein